MAIDLKGSVACVTGGGRGIGRATAEALAARGARVVIGDLDVHHAEEVARNIGPAAVALKLDVADPDSFAAFIAEAERIGPVDLLVNNAGIMRTGVFAEQTLHTQHRELAINLGGVVTGMRLVLPAMLARNRGHIVNVASMAGKMSVPGAAVYTATKFGVASLSRAVRAEIVKSKVSITTILPSAVRTELNAGLDVSGLPVAGPEDVAREIVLSCRHGRPEVTVPRGLGLVGALEQGLPEGLGDFFKRIAGAQKRIAPGNEKAKAYQDRTAR
jgi:NADP-dependent 3-hydroxy acid dehydrogenase YdfG